MGRAVKIIDIDEKGESFVLVEDTLQHILEQVPDEMPVSVVAVAGAFRTGKSFLLDFFLRYLKNSNGDVLEKDLNTEDKTLAWMKKDERMDAETAGFKWSAGSERCTTGIWIWDEHFLRRDPITNKEMAVFLMDTQGIYDLKTGQHLTASIFGLSSLLSSFLVFNLSKQIQEDHFQQLALFSEYGRVASREIAQNDEKIIPAMQKLDFLVRDYEHFEKEFNEEELDFENLYAGMQIYLNNAMAPRAQQELAEVRNQLDLCYEDIRCYCLPHPGLGVSTLAKKFGGDLDSIENSFIRLLGDYVRRVFNERISIKKIHGEEITAPRFFDQVKVYCKLFQDSEAMPQAQTLFQASQKASKKFAIAKAVKVYQENMEALGYLKHFIPEEDIKKANTDASDTAVWSFNENYKSGPQKLRDEGYRELLEELNEIFYQINLENNLKEKEEAKALNDVDKEALDIYIWQMNTSKVGIYGMDEAEFEKIHARAKDEANQFYNKKLSTIKFLSNKMKSKKRKSSIDQKYEDYKNRNKIKFLEEQQFIAGVITECQNVYETEMGHAIYMKVQISTDDLLELHNEAVKAAIDVYKKKWHKNPYLIINGETDLNNKLNKSYRKFQRSNSVKSKDDPTVVISLFVAGREAVELYCDSMETIAGAGSSVKSDKEMIEAHNEALQDSFDCFDLITNNRRDSEHIKARIRLIGIIVKRLKNYIAINKLRKKGDEDEEEIKRLLKLKKICPVQ